MGALPERCKASGQEQRYHQKKPQRQDGGEGNIVVAEEGPYALARRVLYFPDGIERVLELDHDPNRSKDQRPQPEQGSDKPLSGSAGIRQHGLDGLGAGIAEGVSDGGSNLPVDRVSTEEEPGDGDCDNDHGSEREDRIIGQRRSLARVLVTGPVIRGLFSNRPQHGMRFFRRADRQSRKRKTRCRWKGNGSIVTLVLLV